MSVILSNRKLRRHQKVLGDKYHKGIVGRGYALIFFLIFFPFQGNQSEIVCGREGGGGRICGTQNFYLGYGRKVHTLPLRQIPLRAVADRHVRSKISDTLYAKRRGASIRTVQHPVSKNTIDRRRTNQTKNQQTDMTTVESQKSRSSSNFSQSCIQTIGSRLENAFG